MVIGATYRLGTNVRGYATNYQYANQSSVSDTLNFKVDTLKHTGLRLGDELGIGIAIKGGDKWSAEFNYTRSDWRNTGMDTAPGFAVKGNMKISHTEAVKLIDELLTLENPYHCPHGRPTIISMTKQEIEKKFKRIV